MKNLKTFDQLWENIKQNDQKTKLTLETSEKVIKIIKKITQARIDLNISQRALAERCGIQQPALARIETFKIIPKINTLIKIAECVNITIEALDVEQKSNIVPKQIASVVITKLPYIIKNEGVYNYASIKY